MFKIIQISYFDMIEKNHIRLSTDNFICSLKSLKSKYEEFELLLLGKTQIDNELEKE
jgi:hypothetical protein